MSRATVRQAIRDYFAPPNVAGINKIYKAQPVVMAGADFFATPGDQSGAIAFAHIAEKREHRLTPPAGSGWKRVRYEAGLVVVFRSMKADPGAGESDPGEAAADALDTLLTAIEVRLRADRTLGGAVYSAGEGGEDQQDDITIISDLPKLVGETIEMWNVVHFIATEMITA